MDDWKNVCIIHVPTKILNILFWSFPKYLEQSGIHNARVVTSEAEKYLIYIYIYIYIEFRKQLFKFF